MSNPGWYADPSGVPGQSRFWDGQQWTNGVSQGPPPLPGQGAPVGAPPAQTPQGRPVPAWGQGYSNQPFGLAQGVSQQAAGWGPGYAQPTVVAKSPAVSVLLSFFLPGVGSMINGEVGIGVVILVSYIVSYILILALIGILLVPIVWICGMVHAYSTAKSWNAAHGIIS